MSYLYVAALAIAWPVIVGYYYGRNNVDPESPKGKVYYTKRIVGNG